MPHAHERIRDTCARCGADIDRDRPKHFNLCSPCQARENAAVRFGNAVADGWKRREDRNHE